MTEETINTNNGATKNNVADNFVPAWKIKADELKKKAADDEQVVYRSDNYYDCLPILMPKSSVINYPFVAEEPVGFIAPKYNWNVNRSWVETASLAQAKEIEMLKANVADLKATAEDVTKNQETDKTQSAQNTQLLMMITKQVGALSTKIDKLTTPTQPTTSTTEGGNQ